MMDIVLWLQHHSVILMGLVFMGILAISKNSRNNASGTVCRCCHNAPSSGIFFIDSHRIQV